MDSGKRVLTKPIAADWLTCAFGRGEKSDAVSLKRADVVAQATLSSSDSVRRAQVTVAHALTDGQHERLSDRLAAPGPHPQSFAVIIKRLWDETGIRLQLSEKDLRGLFSVTFRQRSDGGSLPSPIPQAVPWICCAEYAAGGPCPMELPTRRC